MTPLTRWVKDFGIYNFEVCYHHGGNYWMVEVYNYKANFLQARWYDFKTFEDAIEALRLFGYHNTARFMLEVE